jgi:hypothetical protein
MRILGIAVSLFLFLAAPAVAADVAALTSPEQRREAAARYDDLVAQARDGDAAIDYTALRLAYPFTDHYDPYAVRTRGLVEDALKSMTAGDCAAALAKADEVLKLDFTVVAIHVLRNTCFTRLGDPSQADLALAIARGLAASLGANADGKSRDTAFLVTSLREENFLLDNAGIARTTQSTIRGNNRVYDLVNGRLRQTGDLTAMWFDVSPVYLGQASRAAAGLPPLR